MKLRKKLMMTIIGLIVNWLAVWLTSKGVELMPDQKLLLIEFGVTLSAVIIMAFNIGQGIADKGKEAGKTLLVLLLAGLMVMMPMTLKAQPADMGEASTTCDTCKGDYKACMELLNECKGPDCPTCEPCEACQNCGWVSLVKDKTFMTAIIGGFILLLGGIAGIFITP